MTEASDPDPRVCFVDTNILVYAASPQEAKKSAIAEELVLRLLAEETFRISTQVVQEFYATMTRKGSHALTARQVLDYIDRFSLFPVFTNNMSAIREAIELSTSQFSFWDALIVVAAARSGAKILYTEDLQDGREVLGLRIVNPFREAA